MLACTLLSAGANESGADDPLAAVRGNRGNGVGNSVMSTSAAVLIGDLDGNGAVNLADIVILRNAIMDRATAAAFKAADLDNDGRLTLSDIVALRNIIIPPIAVNPNAPPVANPKDGWNYWNGGRAYYKNGKFWTGIQTVGSFRYDFGTNGICKTYAGVDVSTYNDNLDWNKMKNAGVEFAIIRAGYRGYGKAGTLMIDDKFHKHIKGAIAAGVDVGVYFFTQAVNEKEAREEAQFVLKNIKGYKLTYPIVIDVEYLNISSARAENIGSAARTAVTKAFCEEILSAGYYPMVYANPDMFSRGLRPAELTKYDTWLAHYTDKTNYGRPFTMWQYSEYGSVSGLGSRCDMNMSYVNYPEVLKAKGYNKLG